MLRILLILSMMTTLLGCLSQPAEEISSLAKIQEQSSLKEAIALGNAGEQQENNQRYEEAKRLTRQAIFKAQAAQEQPNLALAWLIRWHWQLGRILKAQNQIEAAIEAYQQALQILVPENEKAFQWKTEGSKALYEELRQIFLQLADILLQRATTQTTEYQQADLSLARDTMEKLKIVGLDTYFGECFSKKVKKNIDQFKAPQTAVIYPILLPERLELLVSFPVQNTVVIFREKVAVSEDTINAVIHNFRIQIKKGRNSPENKDYLNEAQQLYRWLIAPLLPRLRQHHINTLVFVPEYILNALPIAALHDGNSFIIKEFAVAITPTLSLTEATQEKKLAPSETKVLLSAITEAVQNYPELPYVQKEIQAVNKWYRPKMLLNKEFTSKNFADRLEKSPYDFIHIISHAEFAEKVTDSFILTYDGELKLKDLQESIESNPHEQSFELLTLSACNTAKGDQGWTALGLSGIALKAGARSALATLWKVDDRATFHLIDKFYRHLNLSKQPLSKVRALQTTQQEFLELKFFHHPFYWASLALIGNWL